jgi:tripartite-type tricarboxylate transporter receptor subunit TctC
MVDASKPIKNVQELVAHLKTRPNHGFYGTSNNTGVIAAELFKQAAGLQTTYAPYKANTQALTDLLQGTVDFLSYDATWAAGQVKGGRVRVIAATAAKRSIAFPDVPTLTELGFGGMEDYTWVGVFAPAGTPDAIAQKLNEAVLRAAQAPQFRERLDAAGFEPTAAPLRETADYVRAELVKWAKVVKETGAKID